MKVRVHENTELPWTRIGDISQNKSVQDDPHIRDSEIRYHEPGSDTELQLMEVHYMAGSVILPHWHDTPEIIYVVKGELHLGAKVLGVGSSVFVDRDAVYSFRAGPEGLVMLNFRPTKDSTLHMKKRRSAAA